MNFGKAFLALVITTACGSSTPEGSAPAQPATADQPTAPTAVAEAPTAPNFTLPDLEGADVELAQFAGKTVVLEWFNPGCPFVKYAHGDGPLSDLAAKQTAQGIVWLAINSGAPGNQGHGVGANRSAVSNWKMAHPVLLDETGIVGKLYDATSTPSMVVINGERKLIYKGALDNSPLGKTDGEPMNYVEDAIAASAAGKLPSVRETPSYGCSVKYAQN